MDRQWPQTTGRVLSRTGAEGYVTVKLKPQLRQRSVTVTPDLLYRPATGWHGRARAAVFGSTADAFPDSHFSRSAYPAHILGVKCILLPSG